MSTEPWKAPGAADRRRAAESVARRRGDLRDRIAAIPAHTSQVDPEDVEERMRERARLVGEPQGPAPRRPFSRSCRYDRGAAADLAAARLLRRAPSRTRRAGRGPTGRLRGGSQASGRIGALGLHRVLILVTVNGVIATDPPGLVIDNIVWRPHDSGAVPPVRTDDRVPIITSALGRGSRTSRTSSGSGS
jgi:hypothetical protein